MRRDGTTIDGDDLNDLFFLEVAEMAITVLENFTKPKQLVALESAAEAAVVEGIGDHGCEYMTSGTVVVNAAEGEPGCEDHEDRANGFPRPGRPRRRSCASPGPTERGASHRERLLHERGRWIGA